MLRSVKCTRLSAMTVALLNITVLSLPIFWKHFHYGVISLFKTRVELEFLWMMMRRFAVELPSLSVVLSFKINQLSEILPVRKVRGQLQATQGWHKYPILH